MTPEGPKEEVCCLMGKTNVPSCILVGEAGAPNPEAGTPCKKSTWPSTKKEEFYSQPSCETRPRRVPGSKSDQGGSDYGPRLCPKREAGVTNPEDGTPCKNKPHPALKGGNLPPALTETRPRRVPGRISDQRGSDYQPWLRIDEGGRRDKPGGCRSL